MTQSQRICRSFSKLLVVALVFASGLSGCGAGLQEEEGATPRYYAAWTASMNDAAETMPGFTAAAPEVFRDQTLRQVVRLSLGGEQLRLKLSNLFGTAPLAFSGVRVALSSGQSGIVAGTDRAVLFGGKNSVVLAPGAELFSDPVALPMAPLARLAVTFYFDAPATIATVHAVGRQEAYIGTGDQSAAAAIAAIGGATRLSYYGLSAVETASSARSYVVVAFGDSITDGDNSTVDAAKRYPDQLDDRLKAAGMGRVGLVNEGLSGNRWLNDFFGPSGTSRFERDVLNVAGASHAIIMMGINDIGFGLLAPTQDVSAGQIIAGIEAALAKAKGKGIKVLLATLPPYKGAFYYSDGGEAKRQVVNSYIRNNKNVAGIVDFDMVLRDPADLAALDPRYDSGDHLHPNDAGYGAMAAAVDLRMLRP